jgi:ABC-2 type transport system permease protein/sodium transport system permease protein
MSWLSLLEVFGLLSMFAAFFSAVLLTLTSFARSFKEAQAYLIPLMIFSLAPGLVSLMPGLALRGWVLITPLLNMTLLARDVLRGQAQLDAALIVLGSTLFFAGAAVSLASRVFGADAVLYGSQSSLADLFVRPARTRPAATVGSALLCLAVVFPMIVLTSSLPQLFPLSINVRLSVNALTLLAALGGLPLLWAWHERIEWGTGFGVRPARGAAWAAAALLGASLWTFAYEAIVWRVRAQWINADASTQRTIEELFAQLKVNASPVLLILSLAVIPALVEEFFFRGLLLTSLKHRFGNWTAVLASAIVFGMFHIIGAFGAERVIPSTVLGLVLGAMRLRSGSLFPGMLLHAFHNSLLTLALWLQSRPVGGAGEPLESPLARIIQQTGENVGSLSPIVLGAAVGAVVLGGLLLALSRPVRDEEV